MVWRVPSSVVYHLARHKRKISLASINSLPGKNCLVAAIRRYVQALRAPSEKNKKRKLQRERGIAACAIFGGKTIATHDRCASRRMKNFPG